MFFDSLFLNDDRHLHNKAVIRKNNGKFVYCLIFDNGESLLSDTRSAYSVNENTLDLIKPIESKIIGLYFEKTIDAIEKIIWDSFKVLFY